MCTVPQSWLSLAQTAIGPFVGAGLAFVSALLIQRRARKLDALAAGNLALLTLGGQLSDVLTYRHGLRTELAKRAALSPNAPLWLLLHPIGFHFPESRVFDFKGLSFLFESKGNEDIYRLLANAEQNYFDLKGLQERMVAAATEVQQALAVEFKTGRESAPLTEFEAQVSAELRARGGDLLRIVVERLDGESVYTEAFDQLRTALVRRFGKKRIPRTFTIDAKYMRENLPPLPESFA